MDKKIENSKIERFLSVIKDMIVEVLNQSNLNIEKCYDGIVESVSPNGSVTVKSGDYKFFEIPNKTGEPLVAKDVVRVKTTTKTLSDAYVGVKLN